MCEPTPQDGYVAMKALLTENPDLSAVINTADTTISGMMQAIYEAGRRVPEDFSIVCFTMPRQAALANLALTAIDFPAAEMGRIGTQLLIKRLEGTSEGPEQFLLRPSLTVRQSTGPCVQLERR